MQSTTEIEVYETIQIHYIRLRDFTDIFVFPGQVKNDMLFI